MKQINHFSALGPVLLAILILLSGCSVAKNMGERMEEDFYSLESGIRDNKANESISMSKADRTEEYEQIQKQVDQSPQKPEEEKKIYFGSVKLQVGSVEKVRNSIADLASASGGSVENMYNTYIVIRIPKERFKEIFNKILAMGDVLDKSIETYDVSEFFQDLTIRLDLAEKTRTRLYKLLEKTTDVEERLKILKEIRRLTEEIERITLSLESLQQLINFSRITVELEPRLAESMNAGKGGIPFPWIRNLNPLYASLYQLEERISFKAGEDFAVFDKEKYYHAENPDGVRLRICSTGNVPEGDSDFWQKALEYHLKRFYSSTKLADTGKLKGVLFISKDAKPFYYYIGIIVKKDKIVVAEVLYPDKESYDRAQEDVMKQLSELEVK